MTDSASSPRELRRAETAHALVRASRRATARAGLAGFTVEEICEECGISRRTFFNYFASKEAAVIGANLHRDDSELIAAFIEGGDTGPGITPTLFADLATFAIARWSSLEINRETVEEFMAAIEREPRLLGRMFEGAQEEERTHIAMIEQREGLQEGDLRAQATATVLGAILRSATADFLDHDNRSSFEHLFLRRLDAAQDLFATQTRTQMENPL